MFVGKTEVFYHLLAMVALCPCLFGTFVAAYMNVLRGEELNHFVEHVAQKLESLFFGTENLIEHIEAALYDICLSETARILGIGGKRSEA